MSSTDAFANRNELLFCSSVTTPQVLVCLAVSLALLFRIMVGLIHTPRTIYHIGKGLTKQRSAASQQSSKNLIGVGSEHPYISTGRAGLFDTDYLLHMNNAAYLAHAEYARWEMCACNGLLGSMWNDKVDFMVASTAVRFRREISPIWKRFEVHSFLARLDERHLWIYHTFQYPPSQKHKDPGRIRAHALCQGVAVQGRTVGDPRMYLKDMVGLDAEALDRISTDGSSNLLGNNSSQDIFQELIDHYASMEQGMKQAAAQDDERLLQTPNDST